MLIEVTERAMAYLGKDELVITGGVGLYSRLREMAKIMCIERNAKFLDFEGKYYGDNGVMVAWLGLLLSHEDERLEIIESKVIPKWRIEDVILPSFKISKEDKS